MGGIRVVSVVFPRLLVLVLVVSLTSCASPKSAYQEARAANTIQAYQELVQRFPRSAEASRARRRMAALRLEDAMARGDRALLVQLTKDSHADGAVRRQARRALEQMDLDALIAKGNVAALETYVIKKRPKGDLLAKTRKALDDFTFRDAKHAASVDALRVYLKKHPQGDHVQEARSLIEQIEFADCQKANSYEVWSAFLNRYPDGPHVEAAKQRLADLEAPRIEALMQGLDVTATDKWGGTRLHEAASKGDLFLAKAMIRKDADVNATIERTGITPLHVASLHGQGAVARVLLANGADPNAKDKLGSYPLDLAASKSGVAVVLNKAGGKVNRVIHAPLLVTPPGGFAQYRKAANMVVMRRGGKAMHYINRHGRSPRLSGFMGGSVVYDMYEHKWRAASAEADPYAP